MKQWLKNIPNDTNLKDINLPGAHDACTKICQYSLFSRCQCYSIKEMLEFGVRVFDIRVDGEVCVHSVSKCKKTYFGSVLKTDDVMSDFFLFLEENPTETVLMIFKDEGKIPAEECLNALKEKFITPYPDKWYLENKIPALGKVRGKVVLINRINSSVGIDFTKMPYQGGMKNFHSEDFSPNNFDTVTVQDRYMLTRSKKWNMAVKPMLENSEKYEKNYILNYFSSAGIPLIPWFNSRYINKKFLNFKLKKGNCYGTVMLDFVTPEIAEKIIETN